MDISNAQMEPFVSFLNFHDSFNRQFKAAITAFAYVRNALSSRPGSQEEFLAQMERRWRDGHNWTTADDILKNASDDACRLAITQIHSALDDFERGIQAEFDRWCGVYSKKPQQPGGLQKGLEDEPLWKACQRTGLDSNKILRWQPLLAVFRVMRNCIAHQSSRASSRLAELSSSPQLLQLLNTWPKQKGRRPPPFRAIRAGSLIAIAPKTVILCLDVARRACEDINQSMVDYLGVCGISYMAAFHLLLDEELKVLPISYKKANRAINHILTTRYGVVAPRNNPMIELQRLKKWDKCISQHAALYRNSVAAGHFKLPQGFKMP